jgi:outer membrane murein-binding lipoprotein Lpp
MITAAAVIAAAVLVAGCSSSTAGQPVPDQMAMTTADITGVAPELKPIVNALQQTRVATTPKELVRLSLYFRAACEQRQAGLLDPGSKWSADELQNDFKVSVGRQINGAQAAVLANAFDFACHPNG